MWNKLVNWFKNDTSCHKTGYEAPAPSHSVLVDKIINIEIASDKINHQLSLVSLKSGVANDEQFNKIMVPLVEKYIKKEAREYYKKFTNEYHPNIKTISSLCITNGKFHDRLQAVEKKIEGLEFIAGCKSTDDVATHFNANESIETLRIEMDRVLPMVAGHEKAIENSIKETLQNHTNRLDFNRTLIEVSTQSVEEFQKHTDSELNELKEKVKEQDKEIYFIKKLYDSIHKNYIYLRGLLFSLIDYLKLDYIFDKKQKNKYTFYKKSAKPPAKGAKKHEIN